MKNPKSNYQKKAVRQFTDREEPRASFWNHYNKIKNNICNEDENYINLSVLTYYGIGGIGKSRLIKKLIDELQSNIKKPNYVFYNFENGIDQRCVLEALKNKLSESYKDFSFPLFEWGLFCYALTIGEKAESPEIKKLRDKNPSLNLILNAVDLIPGIGTAAKIFELAEEGIACLRKFSAEHKKEAKNITKMESDELFDYLPVLFSMDMNVNLEGSSEPFVFFFDTYECLVNELKQSGKQLYNDLWLRAESGLVQNIPNVLWVIAGREKLKWHEDDKELGDFVEQHLLGGLSFADSDNFLRESGVSDEQLRKSMYKLTEGMPFYLDLCIDRYEQIKKTENNITIEMLGENKKDLVRRFVANMNDEQQDFVETLSCIRKWDDNWLEKFLNSTPYKFNNATYRYLKTFSFITELGNNKYSMHNLFADILSSECSSEKKRTIGDGLFKIFSGEVEIKGGTTEEYLEAFEHIVNVGFLLYPDSNEEFVNYYYSVIRLSLSVCCRRSFKSRMFALYEKIEERAKLISDERFLCCFLCDKIILYKWFDEKSDEMIAVAKEYYEKLLNQDNPEICSAFNLTQALLDLDHKDLWIENFIKVLKKNKDTKDDGQSILNHLERLARCKPLFSLEIHKKRADISVEFFGESHNETIQILKSLQNRYLFNEQTDEADRIEKILANVNKRDVDVMSVEEKVEFYETEGDFTSAIINQKELLNREETNYGRNSEEVLNAMQRLALLLCKDFNSEAINVYFECLDISTQLYGENDEKTVKILFDMISHYEYEGLYKEASEIYKKIIKIKEKEGLSQEFFDVNVELADCLYLGKFHNECIECYEYCYKIFKDLNSEKNTNIDRFDVSKILTSIARAYLEMNQLETALDKIKEALTIIQKLFGEDIELINECLGVMDEIYYAMKDYEKCLEINLEIKKNNNEEILIDNDFGLFVDLMTDERISKLKELIAESE